MSSGGNSRISLIVLFLLILAGFGYSFWQIAPNQADITTAIQQRTPLAERNDVDAKILDDAFWKELEKFTVHGERPVAPKSENLTRPNPFEGL